MNNLLTEAQLIIANNKSEKASLDFMTTEQRDAIAEDHAEKRQFLSASHYTPDSDKRKEFEQLFWKISNRKTIKRFSHLFALAWEKGKWERDYKF